MKLALLGALLLGPTGIGHTPLPPVRTVTVINEANVRPWVLRRAEHAVEAQSASVRAHWGTPLIRFGPGGWKVRLQYGTGGTCPTGAEGCHWPGSGPWTCDATGCIAAGGFAPFAVVGTQGESWSGGLPPGWTEVFDHEILEMVVDPTLGGREICDAASGYYQADNGVMLSDFVYPAYFQAGATGPYDFLDTVASPAAG